MSDCRSIDCSASFSSGAEIENLPPLFNEQNPAKIFAALEKCLQELKAKNSMKKVGAVAICGQMHGVMLWNPGANKEYADFSSLITWQDQRSKEIRFE